jgi:tetratricopeptide (TPR) repeat protein
MGELAMKRERYQEASQLFREAIGLGMKNTGLYVNLGKSLAELNKYEDIVDLLTPAVEEQRLVDPDLYRILGIALNTTGDYAKGVELLKETLRLWGFNPWVRFQVAVGELGLDQYDRAAEILDALAENDTVKPLWPFIHHLQARILLEDESARDPAAALAKARQAVEEHPSGGDAALYRTLIRALEATGNAEEARRIEEEAVERFPGFRDLQDR